MIHVVAAMSLAAENSLVHTVGEIFHPLFVAVADVLAFIYGIVPNYAAAIIILTLLIMGLLTPLTIKSTRSMVAMQALQPEMQKLRQKYKGAENREQLNQELMRLYKEHGVSPTGGCLPMFLQMPALIVLYDILRSLANTVNVGAKFGSGTIVNGVNVSGKECGSSWVAEHAYHIQPYPPAGFSVCAVPNYIPQNSRMYHDLLRTPGVMKAFGLNLADKPLSHQHNWYDYIPYFVLLALAVGLQYIQMQQMTRRNKAAAQANPQMQMMQKFMPLLFAYIYFLVPAGVVIYMIVSSAIRIGTQDFIFRHGLVQLPGERKIGGADNGAKPKPTGAPRPAGAGEAKGAGSKRAPPKRTGVVDAKATEVQRSAGARGGGNGRAVEADDGGPKVNPAARPPTRKPAGSAGAAGTGRGAANGRTGRNGAARTRGGRTEGEGQEAAKPHPRSKSKRERKAR